MDMRRSMVSFGVLTPFATREMDSITREVVAKKRVAKLRLV
jgi:hypothetical protein